MTFNPLDHPIAFDEPRMLSDASAWVEHIPFALWLVSALRPASIVELGTHKGDSYCAMCQAVATLGLKTSCAAIDTWEGDKHAGQYAADVLEALRRHHDPHYGSFSRLIKSTFDDAAPAFAPASIDLLHIDGLHTYDAVRHDYDTWLPKVRAGGVILFHDTAERTGDFGVWKLWDEISAGRPHFAFSHGHGLGVLGVGDAHAPALRALFDAPAAEADAIRKFFAAAGRGVSLRRLLAMMAMRITGERQLLEHWKRTVGAPASADPAALSPQAALANPLRFFDGYAMEIRALLEADLRQRGGPRK